MDYCDTSKLVELIYLFTTPHMPNVITVESTLNILTGQFYEIIDESKIFYLWHKKEID